MPILLAVILASTPAVVTGAFRHGQWQGRCFRDGTLSGMEDEMCRASWSGNVAIGFERDADRLTLLLSPAGRDDRRCEDMVVLSAAMLARRDRTALVVRAIERAMRRMGPRCRFPDRLSRMNLRDLNATLRETDGLGHVR